MHDKIRAVDVALGMDEQKITNNKELELIEICRPEICYKKFTVQVHC
jgi:hypothetical protein